MDLGLAARPPLRRNGMASIAAGCKRTVSPCVDCV